MKHTPTALLARAADLRRMADELEALAEVEAPKTSEILDLAKLRTEFGFSRESLLSAARGGLPVHRGPRRRLCAFRDDVEAWIRSRAWTPVKARAKEAPDDALARAEAELMASSGGNTRRSSRKKLDSDERQETTDGASPDFNHLRRVK
jgi:hypothetical protein